VCEDAGEIWRIGAAEFLESSPASPAAASR
jgi:hypothetical protein